MLRKEAHAEVARTGGRKPETRRYLYMEVRMPLRTESRHRDPFWLFDSQRVPLNSKKNDRTAYGMKHSSRLLRLRITTCASICTNECE